MQHHEMIHYSFQVQYIEKSNICVICSTIIRRTDDICWCQWFCAHTWRRSPSCRRTLGSNASWLDEPEMAWLKAQGCWRIRTTWYTWQRLITTIHKHSEFEKQRHMLGLPFACKSYTSWSQSRQDWNGSSSKSVTCSPPPDITTMQQRN